MTLDDEAAWRKASHVARASGHVVDPLAVHALEVMVVRRLRRLEARAVAGELDRADAALLDEQLERAVHGRHPQAVHRRARAVEHLARGQGSTGRADDGLDGLALTCGSFHEAIGLPCYDNDKPFSNVMTASTLRYRTCPPSRSRGTALVATLWTLALWLVGAASVLAAPLRVVAAESVYGDIARQIGGDDVVVVDVISQPSQDPHAFEATPAIAREVARADLVIYNGAGYDAWMTRLLSASKSPSRTVIDVAAIAHKGADANPHLWYDVEVISGLAATLAETYSQLDASHGRGYADRLAGFEASLATLRETIAGMRARYARKIGRAHV